jgi:hypothetical protein
MTSVTYNKLFNVRVRNTFYANGNGKNDFAIKPTLPTVQAMRNGNMVFKLDDEGFRVYYKVDGLGNSFVNINNSRLVFGTQMINTAGFLNYTNLNAGANVYASGKLAYFTNKAAPATSLLSYSLLDQLRPSVFTYQFPTQLTVGTGHIVIKNENDVVVTPSYPNPNTITPDAQNRYFYPIDFTAMPAGLYKFETWVNAETPKVETVYINDELAASGAFGVVDIVVLTPTSFPVSPERTYDMQFTARTSQWKYFIVLQSGSVVTADTIGITDEGGAQSPYPALAFGAATNGWVNDIPAKIVSSTLTNIPFFEIPKRQLAIVKNPGASPTKIVGNIAGPAPGLVSAASLVPAITEIYVYI